MRRNLLILAWGLYDLANQFFAVNIISLYFARWLTLEKNTPEIFYSIAFGISTFLVAISAPLLGAISDATQRRRPFLVYLTLLSIAFTMLLGAGGNVFLSLLFFAVANFGYQLATIFYSAMMINVASQDKIGFVSGVGRMFAYAGAILALYLVKPLVLKSGYQASFIPTALLFLLFSLPCLLFIKDKQPAGKINLAHFLKKKKIIEIFKNIRGIIFGAGRFAGLADFLKAAFFGLCALNAVILFMSVYTSRVFGFDEAQLVRFITFASVFAIAGSIFSGFISDYIGHKRCLIAAFILWGICFLGGALARDSRLYWFISAITGVALGATWAVSRSLAFRLVPQEKIGEVFGLFSFIGYLSAIAGAIFWGVLLLFLSPLGEEGYRITLLSLTLFMLLGIIFLSRVPNRDTH